MEIAEESTPAGKPFPAANYITALRILGTLGFLFLQPLSGEFYLVYALTGVTDVLDGWVARKTGTTSAFGAKLDSWADLLFYAVMIGKLFPALYRMLPGTIWLAVLAILCVRLVSYGVAAVKYRTFASLHTYLNKLTGMAIFLIPFVMDTVLAEAFCWSVCFVAGLASLEELAIHLSRQDYDADRKSLFKAIRRNR